MSRLGPVLLLLALAACTREAPPAAPAAEDATEAAVAATPPAPRLPTDSVDVAHVDLQPVRRSGVHGTAHLTRFDEGVRVEVRADGLDDGLHGLAVLAATDCSDAADSLPFDPADRPHGDPEDPRPLHREGDLGNLRAGDDGARLDRIFTDLRLGGPTTVVGRVLAIHAEQDDLNTQPAGGAGRLVACGVIEPGGGT
jgi:Cu-Zn family superoxide dismutase